MRSSDARRSDRRQRSGATAARVEHVGLPYAEASSRDETYDDASALVESYPAVRLPHQAIADRMLADTRWQQICEEISSHGALDRHYLD